MTKPAKQRPAPAWRLTPPPPGPPATAPKRKPAAEPFELTPLGDLSGHRQMDIVELARKKETDQ